MSYENALDELYLIKDDAIKLKIEKFFKLGKDQYGYNDKFLGIFAKDIRIAAKKYDHLTYEDLVKLLKSEYHEVRTFVLVVLSNQLKKKIITTKDAYEFYMSNIDYINNWDLVDISCPLIVGKYLIDKDKSILYELSKRKNIWHRRISVISCMSFIKNNQFEDLFNIVEILLKDTEDLIHKACGWMLREVYKVDNEVLELFILKHKKNMPRVMLRYAIEKFPESKRKSLLK